MQRLSADLADIRRTVGLFLEPGGVVELRAPKTERDGVISGYFSDAEKLVHAARDVSGRAPGVYFTLNRLPVDLLARADNRFKTRAQVTTTDGEITRRLWLLLDFDPVRPAGISSTDAEHDAALEVARSAMAALALLGWFDPVFADSGNGAHLLYRIDLPNDAGSVALLKAVLGAVRQRHNTRSVMVDQAVFNASRISKVYGTVAQKGDSTPERPHRLSKLLSVPAILTPISIEQLQAIASEVKIELPPTAANPSRGESGARPHSALPPFDIESFLSKHGIAIARSRTAGGEDKWVLEACPFNPQHQAPDSAVFRQPNGRLGFRCLHDSCADKDWQAFRELFEGPKPIYQGRPQRVTRPAPPAPDPAPHDQPLESDGCDEIPISAADVEAAADAAIAGNDVVDAMRLAGDVARLSKTVRAVIIAKLAQHFKGRFKSRLFTEAMEEARAVPPKPPDDDDDGQSSSADGPDLTKFPLTDAGNGERMVAMFAGEIRYCLEMKRWLVWDGVRWAVDWQNSVRQKAKAMCRLLYKQGKDRAEPVFQAHARATEAYAAISAALGSTATEPGIPVSVNDLDKDLYLLNCPNGVVDLRDMTLLKHNREFLITKLCPVIYNPKALCPRFISWLEWAMGALNPEAEVPERTARLVGFLQRAFGYALTADVSAKAVFVLYGKDGNNGKTTLVELFRDLLGPDYSGQLSIETVMTMKHQDATMRADMADLRGCRMVVTSEVDKEHKLNERLIKYMTAGDAPIKACRKYENPFEFDATHKLFMDCNHRPQIRGIENAIWNRLKLIPFNSVIAKEDIDTSLPARLRTELQGVLAWSVRGCVDWRAKGLGEPPEVEAANAEWRDHDDPLKEFLEDCCNTGEGLFVKKTDLGNAYGWWAKQNRERFPIGRETFNERLESKGFTESASRRIESEAGAGKKQARTWEGIELKGDVTAAMRKSPQMGWDREE